MDYIFEYIQLLRAPCLLVSLFLGLGTNAEFILVEKSPQGIKAPVFSQADYRLQDKLKQIYVDIINRYQFPMITMHFASMPEEEQKLIIKMLSTAELPEEKLLNHFLHKKHGLKYQFIYIPDTIFEASAIISIIDDLKESRNSSMLLHFGIGGENSYKDKQIGTMKSFWRKELKSPTKQSVSSQRAAFLKESYHPFNVDYRVMKLYFKAVSDLIARTPKLLEEKKWDEVFSVILRDFETKKNKLAKIMQDNASELLDTFDFNAEAYINNIFRQNEGKEILQRYIALEAKVATQGQFLLPRGTQGLRLSKNQIIIDSPYRELGGDYLRITKGVFERELQILKRFGLRPPTRLIPKKSNNYFEPGSLSFSRSLLAGSLAEMTADPQKNQGARSFDYIMQKGGIGYAIPIGIAEYLSNENNISDTMFIAPFNSIIGLMAEGEFFHSRSKWNFNDPGKVWNNKIAGYMPNEAPASVFQDDSRLKIEAFTSPNFTWPTLAGAIGQLIARRSIILQIPPNLSEESLKQSQAAEANFVFSIDRLMPSPYRVSQ